MTPARRRLRSRPLVLVIALGLAAVAASVGLRAGRDAPDEDDRPNFVVVLTDDQTLESMRVMPRTTELIGEAGTTFTRAVANFPLCCPARATLLTGMYAHNHGVRDNVPPDGGFPAFDNTAALPVWLSAAGYETAHVGKFLNNYGSRPATQVVPDGWSRWFAPTDPYPEAPGYYDYDVVVDDGELVHFGTDDADYLTDVLSERAVADVASMAESDGPFYLQVSMLAPHDGRDRDGLVGAVPAPRHIGEFADEPPLITPAIEEEDLGDKPTWLRDLAEPPSIFAEGERTARYRAYLESLLAVDELVERLVGQLDESGVLDRTIIVFTSDNGLTFGEHGLTGQKVTPYEETVDVPLFVRGPGFPTGARRAQPVGHIDVVPTLLAAAGVEAPVPIDGEALQPFAADPEYRADRVVLVENGPGDDRVDHFAGVRTVRWAYTTHGDGRAPEIDLYDLEADPFQLESLHDDPGTAAVRRAYATALDSLVDCEGRDCVVSVTDP